MKTNTEYKRKSNFFILFMLFSQVKFRKTVITIYYCSSKFRIFDTTMLHRSEILSAAMSAGFDLCGMARCRYLSERESVFERWLENGFDSSLEYMRRNIDKRFDPSRLMPGAKSVIVCAVSYKNEISDGYDAAADTPKIASYACAADYHVTIKEMLNKMAESLRVVCPDIRYRRFTDSAPVLEKAWAVEAGLGWIGRNSLLVTPRYGSFVLLGELITDAEIDRYDAPYTADGCGNCRRCIEACAAEAIQPERIIDTRRCISRITVEKSEEIEPEKLHGWVFGCDCCQNVCPYNRKAPQHTCREFDISLDPRSITAAQWAEMSEEEFGKIAGHTPLNRGGYARIRQLCSRKK